MSIITITAGCYSNGKQIAKSVAKRLKYEYVDSEIILSLVPGGFGVSESNLARVLKEAPSGVSMFSKAKPEYIIFIETLLTDYLLKNNIVYYGVIGLPFFQEISHALKVRIIANLEDRIKTRMKLDNISQDKASKIIAKGDEEQAKWAAAIYDIDVTDTTLYDLTINIRHIKSNDVEDAVETTINAVKHKKFQPMSYSLRCIKNIARSCRVRATLADIDSKMQVKSDDGTVFIYTRSIKKKAQNKALEMKQKVMKIEGVKHVEVYIDYDLFSTVAHGQ